MTCAPTDIATPHAGALTPPSKSMAHTEPWWKGAAIYQIYPRSFFDSNGDGIGDLAGITQRLDYIASLGVDAIWLSPFFKSPMADYGYDVSDYCDVDPIFGTLEDFDTLIAKAHQLNLKVIIDQVYSHSSDQHPWFQESRTSKDNPKADWYVWADPKADGSPPNNWQSVFAGSAWQWDARRGQYYLHNFLPEQPDLNLHNLHVQAAILAVPQFWLDRGVDGFRLDALNFGFHNPALTDNPPASQFKYPPKRPHDFQDHVHNMSQPEIYPFLEKIRALMDAYPGRFTVAEIGGPEPLMEMKAYTQGDKRLNTAYAFDFLYAQNLTDTLIRQTLSDWPDGAQEGWPSWAFSNHDAPRAVSRWRGDCPAEDYAKLLCLLMIALRGNIFIYQGEELGLPQAKIAFKDLKDPEAIANWPYTLGRDGARTPMPWMKSAPYAGFSTAKPWLPVSDAHQALCVDQQNQATNSVLNFYRKALQFRQTSDILRHGQLDFHTAPIGTLLIERRLADQSWLCGINLDDNNVPMADVMPAITTPPIFTTDNFTDAALTSGCLPAYSGAIFAVSEPKPF